MDYQQALAFHLAYIVLVLIGWIMVIGLTILVKRNSLKCHCQYDWGNIPEGETWPRCVHCNKLFKPV